MRAREDTFPMSAPTDWDWNPTEASPREIAKLQKLRAFDPQL